jgi:hypothetical protein
MTYQNVFRMIYFWSDNRKVSIWNIFLEHIVLNVFFISSVTFNSITYVKCKASMNVFVKSANTYKRHSVAFMIRINLL